MATTLTDRTAAAIRDALDGRRRGIGALLPFAGPAVVVSTAYVDPGNIATNIQAGAHYGYALLWVVLLANVIAMLFQALSARLGIVTGHNLAQLCHAHFGRPVVWLMWVVSETAALATDLAEFLGGALGVSLLVHISLFAAMMAMAAITYGLLLFEKAGFRPLELIVGALVSVAGLCYVIELFLVPVQWPDVAQSLLKARLVDRQAVMLAVSIVGATVMPHALFLHSGLAQARAPARCDADRTKLLRYSNAEVAIALTITGLINVAMVITSSCAFHDAHPSTTEFEAAFHTLAPLLGGAAAWVFLLSLLASGISSSTVGTMAAQMIMQGFTGFQLPIWLRRAIAIVPSLIVVGYGINAFQALVVSQAILSLSVPFPMTALVWFACDRKLMGAYRIHAAVTLVAMIAIVVVLSLNAVLMFQIFGG